MSKTWTADDVQAMARSFQPACVLAAAAELGVFAALSAAPAGADAGAVADRLAADRRGMETLLDGLAALELVEKADGLYRTAPGVSALLGDSGPDSVLSVVQHQANCLRNWVQLAQVVRTGRPASRQPSIRGAQADHHAFIEAMHQISRLSARALVRAVGPPPFTRLLDIGGGPGTWTIALLQARPDTRAMLVDLPDVLPIAAEHLAEAGLANRVRLIGLDLLSDAPLPAGADLAWVSAVIHMFDRRQARGLFTKVHAALPPGGRIVIRDVVMQPSRVEPVGGALFAVNMLVNTPTGRTYTLAELQEDLAACGFGPAELLHRSAFMDSVVTAVRR